MAWIHLTPVSGATGLLRRQFQSALDRAGRVWNIIRIMSPNPRTLDASMKLYSAIMKGPSPLSRVQREMIAVVVSAELGCHY
jgi:alkylhydroperoxidase family enzyme